MEKEKLFKPFSLKKISLNQQTFLFFLIMNFAIIIIFIIFMLVISKLNSISNRIIAENISSIEAVYNVKISILNLKGLKANYFLDHNPGWIDDFNQKIEDFYFWYGKAGASAETTEEQTILGFLKQDFLQYLKIHHEILELAEINNAEGIKMLLTDSHKIFQLIYERCEALIRTNEKLITTYSGQAINYMQQGQIIGYILIIGFFGLSVFLSAIFAGSITAPIKEMTSNSKRVLAEHGINFEDDHNELSRFKKQFDTVIDSLNEKQQKLSQADQRTAVGELAAGVSHELNNPIGIIYGFAERLLNKEGLDASQRLMVEKIFSEAERCKYLLREFLDFAKPMQLHPGIVCLNDMLRDLVNTFSMQDKTAEIKFPVSLPENNCELVADNYRIKQVFINILLNAMDAVNHSTEKKIAVSLTETKNAYLIKIRDSGEGILPEQLTEIFKPFYSTKHKGTGLGLSISREIIEKHGGKIIVESEYQQWTEFQILLPKQK